MKTYVLLLLLPPGNSLLTLQVMDLDAIIIVALAFLFILIASYSVFQRNKLKEASKKIQNLETRIVELNKSIGALIRDSDIDVYMFDEIGKELYKFADGDYQSAGFELEDIESKIHPDDMEQYCKDYSDMINNVKETVVSRVRIYNNELKKFEEFEHIVNPIKRNAQGIVTKYLYTKHNRTAFKEDLLKQNELKVTMHLALKAGQMMRWSYDVDTKISKMTDKDDTVFAMCEEEFIHLISPQYQTKYLDFINELTTNQLRELSIELEFKRRKNAKYNLYQLTAICYYDTDTPLTIYGIWQKITDTGSLKSN